MDYTRKPRAQPLLPAGEMLQQRCRTHAHGRLSQSARNGELRGLGHAVVDHLRGNLDRTLAGNCAASSRSNSAGSGEHSEHLFEKMKPIVIADLLEGLDLKNPQVVHQDVQRSKARDACCSPSAVLRLATNPSTLPRVPECCRCFKAAFTLCSVRPFTTTDPPSFTNASAIANPIPAVLPVTSACLPSNLRSLKVRCCGCSPMIQHDRIL